MKSYLIIVILLANVCQIHAQSITEKDAKAAVAMIVHHSGLPQNFEVRENQDIKTAIAFIKGRQRFIEYNPEVIASIIDSSNTDWSAIAILAHEIGHHLMGHTLDPTNINLGDELACDKYSGFILQHMGASLKESTAVMTAAGSDEATKSHPPRSARIEAITLGWEEASNARVGIRTPEFVTDEFIFKVQFEGDDHLYYVDRDSTLLWFDNYANPISLGNIRDSESDQFQYILGWQGEDFFVDTQGQIWNMTAMNMMMIVGKLEEEKP